MDVSTTQATEDSPIQRLRKPIEFVEVLNEDGSYLIPPILVEELG